MLAEHECWQPWFHCPLSAMCTFPPPGDCLELSSSLLQPDCTGCPASGTNTLPVAPDATVQPGTSTFQVSCSYNRLRQGSLNPVRYHRQSQEFHRPLLHKTSPETLQPTPFLYRVLSANTLKTFLSAIQQKKLLELIHPVISDSICSALNFSHWHPSGKTTQAAACCASFLPNGYQLIGHSEQMQDFFTPAGHEIPQINSSPNRSAHFNTF